MCFSHKWKATPKTPYNLPKERLSGVAPANQTKERSVHELFRRGIPEQKFEMWIVLAFLRKTTRIHKNGRNSWTFRFGPFFGLVYRGDSWVWLGVFSKSSPIKHADRESILTILDVILTESQNTMRQNIHWNHNVSIVCSNVGWELTLHVDQELAVFRWKCGLGINPKE